jgi:SAM-dependent methyltransferase
MDNQHIINCYDKTAKAYAAKYLDELTKKHLDRILLNAFATENREKGKFIDLGCGPGQTTKFLYECGIKEIVGTDISPAMIQTAKEIHPHLPFEVADMLALQYANEQFAAVVAFYAIVHFNDEQLVKAIQEVRRVLKKGGEFLFSFHVGDQVVHLDEFLDQPVQIDFHFFDPAKVLGFLTDNGFELIDAIERQPYKEVEYPSKRSYIWAKKM